MLRTDMKRNVSLEEISDGKLYTSADMAKLGCGDCEGCSSCCHGMGESVILDPMDIARLSGGLHKTFDELLALCLELHVVDGVILPNLRMTGDEEACPFLDGKGRCSVHELRPGVCRLFPLGRYYENHGFRYFLQLHECKKENRTKVKIKKWLDTPDLAAYENYITDWHYFLEEVEKSLETSSGGDAAARTMNLYLLKSFYQKPYSTERPFYEQFYERLSEAKKIFG